MRDPELQKKTDRLLDAIGGIDDAFVQEAMDQQELSLPSATSAQSAQSAGRPTAIRSAASGSTRKRSPLRALLIAASLVLVLAVGMSAMFVALVRSGNKKAPSDGEPGNVPGVERSLDLLLADCTQSAAFTPCTAEAIPYFDGTVRIAVENRSTGELFVSRPLSAAEKKTVDRELKATGTAVETSPAEAYRVWVTFGDGTVVTPCLAVSYGNIGAGDLFDYASEREPTELFTGLLYTFK